MSLLIILLKFENEEKNTFDNIFIVKYTHENKYCTLIMTTKITTKIRCTKVDQNCPKYTVNHNRSYWRQSFLCGRASRVEQFASGSSSRGQSTLF